MAADSPRERTLCSQRLEERAGEQVAMEVDDTHGTHSVEQAMLEARTLRPLTKGKEWPEIDIPFAYVGGAPSIVTLGMMMASPLCWTA
jgi:hypothetical protein